MQAARPAAICRTFGAREHQKLPIFLELFAAKLECPSIMAEPNITCHKYRQVWFGIPKDSVERGRGSLNAFTSKRVQQETWLSSEASFNNLRRTRGKRMRNLIVDVTVVIIVRERSSIQCFPKFSIQVRGANPRTFPARLQGTCNIDLDPQTTSTPRPPGLSPSRRGLITFYRTPRLMRSQDSSPTILSNDVSHRTDTVDGTKADRRLEEHNIRWNGVF